MSLESITSGLIDKIGEDCGLGKILKFDFGDDGVLMLDATQVPNVVSNESADAHCTLVVGMENFLKMASGELNSMAAFMSGKLKVHGDMGIAMKLAPILG